MSAAEPRGQRFALLGAALLVVILVLLTGGEPKQTVSHWPSTVLLGDGGAKGLFDVAQLLELEPRQWMRPLTALDEVPDGVMVLLEQKERLAQPEIAALMRFVDRGGNFVYAPGEGDGLDEGLLGALGLDLGESNDGGEEDGDDVSLLIDCSLDTEFTPHDSLSADGKRWIDGLEGPVRGIGRGFAGVESDAVEPLLVAPNGTMGLARVSRPGDASGTILLLADAAGLTNGEIEQSELAPIVLRACADLRGSGPLWFDEYHHGFDETGSVLTVTWGWLTSSRTGNALLALAIVGVLAAAWAGLRFGAPIPRPLPERRSALEHVDALARAWHRSRATRRPRELLIEGLRLRLGSAAELAPIAELSRAAAQGADPIELARRVDEVLAELRPATLTRTSGEGSGGGREASRGGTH